MDQLPPISPYGVPLYPIPGDETSYDLKNAFHTIALTLNDNVYRTPDGHIDITQLGGLVDVIDQFARKLGDDGFLSRYTDLCSTYEEMHKTNSLEHLGTLQKQLETIGDQHPEIPRNMCTSILIGLLQNIHGMVQEIDHERG